MKKMKSTFKRCCRMSRIQEVRSCHVKNRSDGGPQNWTHNWVAYSKVEFQSKQCDVCQYGLSGLPIGSSLQV